MRLVERDAGFAGRFLGEGANGGEDVIGTWELEDSIGRSIISGAFGAERGSATTVALPTIDDDGIESRTFLGAEPDSSGDLRLGGSDAEGNSIEFSVAQLLEDGYAVSRGERLFTIVRKKVERDLGVLDLAVVLENVDLRENLWDRVRNALDESIFEAGAPDVLGRDFPKGRGGAPDDDEARETLWEVAGALSSAGRFEDALDDDGIFYAARNDVGDLEDMYAVRGHELRVEFGTSHYTRFGVWAKTVGERATDGMELDSQHPPAGFAYSPLAQTTYTRTDIGYPTNSTASYSGRTVAVDTGSGAPVYYEGRVSVQVDWGSDVRHADVYTVVRDLISVEDGGAFRHNGRGVDAITIGATSIDTGSGNEVEFGVSGRSSPAIRIRYLNAALSERSFSGTRSHSGKFVGESIDGPLAVIGTYSLIDTRNDIDLAGAYGADLVP